MVIVLKNSLGEEYYRASYDSENHWVYNDWHGFVTLDEVIKGSEETLQLLKASRSTKILNDNRHLSGTWSEATGWLSSAWIRRAEKAGVKKIAHILSSDILGMDSAREFGGKIRSSQIEFRLFGSKYDAEMWLKEQVEVY